MNPPDVLPAGAAREAPLSMGALTRLCGARDRALHDLHAAIASMAAAHEVATQAIEEFDRELAAILPLPNQGGSYRSEPYRDRTLEREYKRVFAPIDTAEACRALRLHLDAAVWRALAEAGGYRDLMDAEDRRAFVEQLQGDAVPEVSESTIQSVAQGYRDQGYQTFLRGISRAFIKLDRRFKSHDAFEFQHRVILSRVRAPGWSYIEGGPSLDTITDIERTFAMLDGDVPQPGELRRALVAGADMARGSAFAVESRYFRVRVFKNGNAHLWFTRADLVKRANELLAEYYGQVLPDAAPSGAPPSTALARDLQFYRTPRSTADLLVARLPAYSVRRILEPSIGDGALIGPIRDQYPYAQIDGVEVDPGRADLAMRRGAAVQVANFLQVPPNPVYDAVVMNPPFYGNHWMAHVRHAFDFLAPGGTLVAILPATAEVGSSSEHEAFRAWAGERANRYDKQADFQDLPDGSFRESGTNVQTVTLRLRRRQ